MEIANHKRFACAPSAKKNLGPLVICLNAFVPISARSQHSQPEERALEKQLHSPEMPRVHSDTTSQGAILPDRQNARSVEVSAKPRALTTTILGRSMLSGFADLATSEWTKRNPRTSHTELISRWEKFTGKKAVLST